MDEMREFRATIVFKAAGDVTAEALAQRVRSTIEGGPTGFATESVDVVDVTPPYRSAKERLRDQALSRECAMFETMREELNADPELRGKYVLFQGGKPVSFWPDANGAFEEGIHLFGLDTAFMITKIETKEESIRWF